MTPRSLTPLFFVLAAACATPRGEPHGSHHRFEDADQWAPVFEAEDRDAWQRPDEVIAALALPPDASVADLGAGTGYFAVRLARAVPKGKVFAVDVEQDMVRYLRERAAREKLSHLKPVLAAPHDARLPEAVDLILVVNTYHHIHARSSYFAKLAAQVGAGGQLAIVDFRPGQPLGPPEAERIPAEEVTRELTEAGWKKREEHSFLPNQYFLVFER